MTYGTSTKFSILINNIVLFQALYSLTKWPFSLKLLWAPLVDALYVQKFGRRKSWLLPVQYLIGM